jgi:hypothetical protein
MSTIPVPNSIHAWPRTALLTVLALLAALAVTIALAVGAFGHTTTRTVVRQATAFEQSYACHVGRPC